MKINVTKRHISQGRRGDCYACPVALALAMAGFDGPHVFCDGFTFGVARQWRRRLPFAVRDWIAKFDWDDDALPFSFSVRRPSKVQKGVAS